MCSEGMNVAADTSPLNYLVLISEIGLLPALYDSVLIPEEVHRGRNVESCEDRTDSPYGAGLTYKLPVLLRTVPMPPSA